jgi:hypothetical protein
MNSMILRRPLPDFGRFLPLAALALALFAGAGCASREIVTVHGDPVVCAEGKELLVVHAALLEDGGFSLRAWRQRDRLVEMEYWRMEIGDSSEAEGIAVAGIGKENKQALQDFAEGISRAMCESAGRESPCEAAPDPVASFFRRVGRNIASLAQGIASIFGAEQPPAPGDERATVRRQEVARSLSRSIVLQRIEGSGLVWLGPQPTEGYRIDKAEVERLGGPGTRIRVVDGELETEITLGSPR